MTSRIGVFGGTFDPPHLGHLILAAEACAQLQLTRLLWVLTAAPPHKSGQPVTAVADRLQMVKLAIQDEAHFELSSVELERPGPHYTVDTLALLRASHPGSTIVLLLGGDSLRDLPTWRNPGGVIAAADELGVMRRPADEIELSRLDQSLPGASAKVRFIEAPLLEIASHEIRRRARAGLPFRYYVPAPVYEYIRHHHLYQHTT